MKLEFYPESKILLQRAEPVERFDSELSDIIEEMFKLMYAAQGVGLAAPQVGIQKRFFILDARDKNTGKHIVAVNPDVHKCGNKTNVRSEACLSMPGITGNVRRFNEVVVEYYDTKGDYHWTTCSGLAARAAQHEADHLDGWLFPFYNLPMNPEDYFIERDPRPMDIITPSDVLSLR